MAIKRYVGDRFIVDSTDTKPLNLEDGAISDELDTLRRYVLKSGAWVEFSSSSGQISSNLTQTGVQLINLIDGLSGKLVESGNNLQSQITTLNNLPKVTGVSVTGSNSITGLINLSGIAGTRIIHSGINNILISGRTDFYTLENPSGFITNENVVFTTGEQTISDHKTFTDTIIATGIQLVSGAQDSYVLTSDAHGNASWQEGTSSFVDDGTFVRITGDQNISGIKNFLTNLNFGTTRTDFPINFPDTTGNKISLRGQTDVNYGLGIGNNVFQIFSPTDSSRTSIGYGQFNTFTEVLSVKGKKVGINNFNPTGFALEISGDIGPLNQTVFNLGSSLYRWQNIFSSSGNYLSGVTIGGERALTGIVAGTNITVNNNGNGSFTINSTGGGGGGGTDENAIHDNVAGEIAAITEKTTPIYTDWALIEDAEASNAKKKVTLDNIRRPAVHLYTGFQSLDQNDYIVQAQPSGGAFDLTLPLAANSANVDYWIKNIHNANSPVVRIVTSGSDNLEFGGHNFFNLPLSGMDSIKIFCDGTQWWTLSFLSPSGIQLIGGGTNDFNIWLEGAPVV